MTATLAGMLIDEGKLRWDTTIADVFPELKGRMNQQYENVTVEQLLTHRGGVPGDAPRRRLEARVGGAGTPVEQRHRIYRSSPGPAARGAPGTKMIYSNQGYAIVGAMLGKNHGHSL